MKMGTRRWKIKMSNPEDTLKIFDPDPKTYNHMFDLAFQVEGSEYKDGYECIEREKEKIIKALTDRVHNLLLSEEYSEAFGLCNTFEE